jgi:hypothetical protein
MKARMGVLVALCLVCAGCDSGYGAGTWTDPTSGQNWQVTPVVGIVNWFDAKSYCADLSLDGGGWHLPTIGELRTLIRGCPSTEHGGSCNIEEGNCLAWSCFEGGCNGCDHGHGPGEKGEFWPDEVEGDCGQYWSSSRLDDDDHAWAVNFSGVNYDGGNISPGHVTHDADKYGGNYVVGNDEGTLDNNGTNYYFPSVHYSGRVRCTR